MSEQDRVTRQQVAELEQRQGRIEREVAEVRAAAEQLVARYGGTPGGEDA